MDSLFTNGHNITIPAKTNMNFDLSNNVELSPTDALKLMMNKRKLELTATINGEEKNQENGSEGAKPNLKPLTGTLEHTTVQPATIQIISSYISTGMKTAHIKSSFNKYKTEIISV
ncbi:unnamed protein product [Rotaria magnacalcarata]